MHGSTYKYRGFEYLEFASKRVESWPSWKKKLAGIDTRKNENKEQEEPTYAVSCSHKDEGSLD